MNEGTLDKAYEHTSLVFQPDTLVSAYLFVLHPHGFANHCQQHSRSVMRNDENLHVQNQAATSAPNSKVGRVAACAR